LTETLNSPSIETIVDGNNPPSSSFLKIDWGILWFSILYY
jgi:hypothetical protein